MADWSLGVDAPRNLVLVSVPSLLDPSLAPEGHHVIHAYTPATEPCTERCLEGRGLHPPEVRAALTGSYSLEPVPIWQLSLDYAVRR